MQQLHSPFAQLEPLPVLRGDWEEGECGYFFPKYLKIPGPAVPKTAGSRRTLKSRNTKKIFMNLRK